MQFNFQYSLSAVGGGTIHFPRELRGNLGIKHSFIFTTRGTLCTTAQGINAKESFPGPWPHLWILADRCKQSLRLQGCPRQVAQQHLPLPRAAWRTAAHTPPRAGRVDCCMHPAGSHTGHLCNLQDRSRKAAEWKLTTLSTLQEPAIRSWSKDADMETIVARITCIVLTNIWGDLQKLHRKHVLWGKRKTKHRVKNQIFHPNIHEKIWIRLEIQWNFWITLI